MFPLRDENPHPPGFKPKVTIALIIINAIVFFIEVAITGQFFDFTNQNAFVMFYDWGSVPNCVTGATFSAIDFGAGPVRISCPTTPYISLISSTFMHGGLLHFAGNMWFLWIFGDPSSVIPAVGASGAISGVLGAYLVIFPKARIQTFLMMGFFWRMMHIQARWFLPFWLVFQNLLPFFIGGFGIAGGGVAYLAHIGGFVIGLATGYIYKKTHSSDFMYGTRYGYRSNY